jgi:uncharacterized protein (TIGR02231 family)
MKNLFLLILFFWVHQLWAQEERDVESKVTDVVVFLNNAQVTRQVKTRVEPGKSVFIVKGLTSQLQQESIQVSGKGDFIILGISHRQNYLSEQDLPKAIRTLKDSVEEYQRALANEQNQREILNREEQLLLNNQKIGGANQNLSVAELKAMADFFRARMNDISISRTKHDDKIRRITERITKLQNQIRDQHALYTKNTSEILISISSDKSTAAEFIVKYIVPNAGWVPVYDLRAINTKSPMQLSYKANVFQNTGEDWKNVRLTLSTANPTQQGIKPVLNTWYLDVQQRVISNRRYRYADAKAEAPTAEMAAPAELQEVDEEKESATMAQYTSSIQTTLHTEFSISLPYTVHSSAKPTLVDIQNHEMNASYLYSVVPKMDPDAFLMANITGWEDFDLLPGEVNVFFEGTFVSKSFIDPSNIKDTLSISLGRDKRIVVKREKLKDFSSRKLIGSNQKDLYAYEISVRNTKGEAILVRIEDQVPVSQSSDIEVNLTEAGGAKHDVYTGILQWELKVLPNETKKVNYKFDVKYPKNKIIAGL